MLHYGIAALLLGVLNVAADPLPAAPAGGPQEGNVILLPPRNLAIRTPVTTDYVNQANQSVFRVSGICRAGQGLVHLVSPVRASTSCGVMGFSFNVDLSGLRTSTVLFRAEQRVVENNQVYFHSSEVRIARDVVAPSAPLLVGDSSRVDSVTYPAHRFSFSCESGARVEYALEGEMPQTQLCGSTQEKDLSALIAAGSRTGIPFAMRTIDRAGNASAWRSETFSVLLGLQQEHSTAFAISEDGASVTLQRSAHGRLRLLCRGADLVESASRVAISGKPVISPDGLRRGFVTASTFVSLDANCTQITQVGLPSAITELQSFELALGNDGSLLASQAGNSTTNAAPPHDSYGNEARFVQMGADGTVQNSQSFDARNCDPRLRAGLYRRAAFVAHPERDELYLACDVLMLNSYAGMESVRSIQRRDFSGRVLQGFALVDVITLEVGNSVSFAQWKLSPSGHLFVLYSVFYAGQNYRQARTFNGVVWSARTNFVVGPVYTESYSPQFIGDSIIYAYTQNYGATQKRFVRLSATPVSGTNVLFQSANDAGRASTWDVGYGFGSLVSGELVHGLGHGDQMTSELRALLRH